MIDRKQNIPIYYNKQLPMYHIRNWFRNMIRKIFTLGYELCYFYINRICTRSQLLVGSNWDFSPGFQLILKEGFCLVIFKGTQQVKNNIKNTSLVFTASRSRNINWIPHDKEHIQHPWAGTFPSHGFPFIFGFTPFMPRKRGSFIKASNRICSFSSVYNRLIVYNRFCLLSQVCTNIY